MAVKGFVDGVIGRRLVGWAYDPEAAEKRLEVQIEFDGADLGRAVADVKRRDLASAGIGDGRHAFRVELAEAPVPGSEHELLVTECESRERIPLHRKYRGEPEEGGAPLVLREAEHELEAAPPAGPLVEGYVEGILDGRLIGWARDPSSPDRRVELEVHLDDHALGTVVADLLRGDLEPAGIGDGRHAFRVEVPGQLEAGSAHTVTAIERESRTIVPVHPEYLREVEGGRVVLQTGVPAHAGSGPSSAAVVAAEGHGAAPAQPAPGGSRALLGEAGWLFSIDSPETLERIVGARSTSSGAIEELARRLHAQARALAEVGVEYLPVLVPDKSVVHDERLPPLFAAEVSERLAARLVAVLRDVNGVEPLDLHGALRDARRHGPVYLRQGTSLTWSGAFHGYRAVAKELSKAFRELEPAAPETLLTADPVAARNDLAGLPRAVAVGSDLVPVQAPATEEPEREPGLGNELAAAPVPAPTDVVQRSASPVTLLRVAGRDDLPSALVVDDGSGHRMIELLAEHFARTTVVAGNSVDTALAAAAAPSLVVQFLSDRSIADLTA